ncbi:MAG: hypothetical protein JW776_00900 [Candidatus Lokiarchaeota archaeon]|nr:hypothetical protein [Candidatus Lokiarchaeota archaeon]
MWRKFRDSVTTKQVKRIKGRKTSLLYQNQILKVQQIFTYSSRKRIFYQFFVKGNLPHIQKNKKQTQFLGIQLSKGSSLLLTHLIREVLKCNGSREFFFIQYPVYSQTNIQYLILLIRLYEDSPIHEYEQKLMKLQDEFTNTIKSLVKSAFRD